MPTNDFLQGQAQTTRRANKPEEAKNLWAHTEEVHDFHLDQVPTPRRATKLDETKTLSSANKEGTIRWHMASTKTRLLPQEELQS